MSGGCVAPPAAGMHLDRHLLLACTWPHRRVEGVFPPRREILLIYRTKLICIMCAALQWCKWCGYLRCNGQANVYHVQQWTGVGVVTVQWTGVDVVTVRRSGNRGWVLGTGSAASGQDLGPPASCLRGVRCRFLLGKSGSDGDYFRPSVSETEDTVPPLHHTLSLCGA